MAASYPTSVKIFSAVVNGVTKLVASLFNSPYDEITAIETELGTDVAGSMADLKTRLAVSMNDNGTLKGAGMPSYDSGWFAVSNNTEYAKTHNLGTTKVSITIMVAENNDGSGWCFSAGVHTYISGIGERGMRMKALSTTSITVRAADNFVEGSDNMESGYTSGYCRIIMVPLA